MQGERVALRPPDAALLEAAGMRPSPYFPAKNGCPEYATAASCPVVRMYWKNAVSDLWPVNFITSETGIPAKTALVANDLRAV